MPRGKTRHQARYHLVTMRVNKKERKAFYAMCKSMGIKPATQLRDMALAFAGLPPGKRAGKGRAKR
jgi:hypothetical protein